MSCPSSSCSNGSSQHACLL